MYLYLSISGVVVSPDLVKDEDRNHVPVHFVSKVLRPVEMKYLEIKNYLYSLIILAPKLRTYFYVHIITVLTNQPLKHFLQKFDASRRMAKWAVELSKFPINFAPITTIKGQTLFDFIVESMSPPIEDMMPIIKSMDEKKLSELRTNLSSLKGSRGKLGIDTTKWGKSIAICLGVDIQSHEQLSRI